MSKHHKKITRAMKQTKVGQSHSLSKHTSEAFSAYGAS